MKSVLQPETLALLAAHKVSPPHFSSMGPAELFDQQTRHGRFRVLTVGDRKSYVVFDPAAPFPNQAVARFPALEDAVAKCKELSLAATARGEKNEPDVHGFKLNWGDPKTWEKTADI